MKPPSRIWDFHVQMELHDSTFFRDNMCCRLSDHCEEQRSVILLPPSNLSELCLLHLLCWLRSAQSVIQRRYRFKLRIIVSHRYGEDAYALVIRQCQCSCSLREVDRVRE